jgi:hypothetical protein
MDPDPALQSLSRCQKRYFLIYLFYKQKNSKKFDFFLIAKATGEKSRIRIRTNNK